MNAHLDLNLLFSFVHSAINLTWSHYNILKCTKSCISKKTYKAFRLSCSPIPQPGLSELWSTSLWITCLPHWARWRLEICLQWEKWSSTLSSKWGVHKRYLQSSVAMSLSVSTPTMSYNHSSDPGGRTMTSGITRLPAASYFLEHTYSVLENWPPD